MQNKLKLPGGSGLLALLVSALVLALIFAVIDGRLAVGAALMFALILIFYFGLSLRRGLRVSKYFENLLDDMKFASHRSLLDIPLPVTILRKTGEILWTNDRFSELSRRTGLIGSKIEELSPGFNTRALDNEHLYLGFPARIGDRSFRVYGTFSKSDSNRSAEQMLVLYWTDITDEVALREQYGRSRPIVALIHLDSFEDLSSLSESDKATVISRLESYLSEWAKESGGVFRSTDRGRYIFFCELWYLKRLVSTKFDILDKMRQTTLSERAPISISIGIGVEGETLAANHEFAKQALDMAFGRGGDQAVIKNKNNFEFYGGKSKTVEKRTKVKARVMAGALSELLERCSNVLVMGHKFSDYDSIGACVGIARAAFVKDKPVNIVVNRSTMLAAPIIDSLETLPLYDGVFVDPAEALDLIESRTLLVVCDTHSPVYVESHELLENCGTVVVIDHHRKMAESITGAVQFYHEPFASSACEIVTELIEYIDGNATILKEEAEAILAGIVLDTKNFYFKTGFRTFEAAAYLRKAGADLITLKRLFKSDYLSYVRRTELITAAQFYRDNIAISMWDGPRLENAKVVMSQAADELLNIEEVDASFVLYCAADSVHISGRSLGTVNVQLILEKLGGGGHMTTAGAQVKGTADEVKARLRHAIDEYYDSETKS